MDQLKGQFNITEIMDQLKGQFNITEIMDQLKGHFNITEIIDQLKVQFNRIEIMDQLKGQFNRTVTITINGLNISSKSLANGCLRIVDFIDDRGASNFIMNCLIMQILSVNGIKWKEENVWTP